MSPLFSCVASLICGASSLVALDPGQDSAGWEPSAPRPEIRPAFAVEVSGGRNGARALVIAADAREGLHGAWTKRFPVTGGRYYQFSAHRRTQQVEHPRRSALVKITWENETGEKVLTDLPLATNFLHGAKGVAEAEHPSDEAPDATGWTRVSGHYRAPPAAKFARIELGLLWAKNGKIHWSDIQFGESSAPAPRKVRLATVHLKPQGKAPGPNRELFAPLIAEAARQKADLVVLPETLTYYGAGLKPDQVAESIPGPSTDYFGVLAKKHSLYVVAGLYERDGHVVYNVAVLLDPDGRLAGKYRKVTLPTGEVDAGVAPGNDYPVFETRLGKVGMMVCYDGFFPEVARELTNRGAEIIAWPVWGCNPELARARARRRTTSIW